jgi:hypothetical protein
MRTKWSICFLVESIHGQKAISGEIERKGFLTGEESHSVFAPIHFMINHQISFLMGLEMNLLKALTDRIWRTPFSNFV